MSDVLVFLTATFDCGQTPYVKRCDPLERKEDYLQAFRAWLSLDCDADFLLCENSNADLASFREVAMNRPCDAKVRLLSFPGNAGAQDRGKGYGEIEILRYAFDTLPELKDYRYIVKVTGRYRVMNGVMLIDRIRRMSADIICDVHRNLTHADTTLFAFRPSVALDYLLPYQEEIDDHHGAYVEHLTARCVHRTLLANGSWAPLPCTPHFVGVSGTSNTVQHNTLRRHIKQGIKRKIGRWIYYY